MPFEEIFRDNQKLFDQLLIKKQLEQYISVKILANNRIKQIGKVIKVNELLNYFISVDIIIIINEAIFDKLTLEQKEFVIEMLVSDIYFDLEKFEVKLVNSVTNISNLIGTIGYAKYEALTEIINTLYNE